MSKLNRFAMPALAIVTGLLLLSPAMAARVNFIIVNNTDKSILPFMSMLPDAGNCIFPGTHQFTCSTDKSGQFSGQVQFRVERMEGPVLTIRAPGGFTFGKEGASITSQISPIQWDGKSNVDVTITFSPK